MKVNPLLTFFNPQLVRNVNQSQTSQQTYTNKNLQNNSMSEVLGRSQVNFTARKNDDFRFSNADKKFLEQISVIFDADKKQVRNLKHFTKEFFKENNVKTFKSFKSDDPCEFANELGYYNEQVDRILDLSEDESLDFMTKLIEHIESDEIKQSGRTDLLEIQKDRDFSDLSLLAKVSAKYISARDTEKAFEYLTEQRLKYNKESIFDLFKEENKQLGTEIFDQLATKISIDDENDKIDFFLDLYQVSKKNQIEREVEVKDDTLKGLTNMLNGVVAAIITRRISEHFDINLTSEEVALICERKTKEQQNGRSLMEIAFKIASNHELSSGAEKEIIKIINTKIDAATLKDAVTDLMQIFIEGPENDDDGFIDF